MTASPLIIFLHNSRVEAGQTTAWLGGQIGEKASRIEEWEAGEGSPPLRKAERWADLFGCEVTLRARVEPKVRRRDYGALSVFGSPTDAGQRSVVSARELLLGKGAP
jgi:hypothetical protein